MEQRPFFLVTNDDGVHSPGLHALADELAKLGDVLIIAPAVERSGFSQAITLMTPFRVERVDERTFSVDGTPADCVVYGLFHELKGRRPDWVVSGINRGANLGNDTLYSGTVGAAMEAACNGFKAMAVSLVTEQRGAELHFATAAHVAARILARPGAGEAARGRVINVNVPNRPLDQVVGVQVAELSQRHYDKSLRVENRPDGRLFCSYGGGPVTHDGKPGNDSYAVDQGFASVTLLKPSMLDADGNQALKRLWDEGRTRD